MTIDSAQPQLLDLAAEMRKDWDRDQLAGALAAAHNADWTWKRTFLEATRLMADEDASPRDLTEAVRNPLRRGEPASPDVVAAAMAEMRGALGIGGES